MKETRVALVFLAVTCLLCGRSSAENAADPLGEPVLEAPTLHCLGVWWIVRGDDNRNARIGVEYRKTGGQPPHPWEKGPPLFRVEKGAHVDKHHGTRLRVPEGAWLFAGSVLFLDPDTAYQLRLMLTDRDGGAAEKILSARTLREPTLAEPAAYLHVVPGRGGGEGTKEDPFRGLEAAQAAARPGVVFLLHAGVYPGTFTVRRSGSPGRPIVWRGAGDGEAVIDAKGAGRERPERGISTSDVHHVWFEKLTVREAKFSIVAHRTFNIVIRRCHIHSCEYGITTGNNSKGTMRGTFISDNLIEGPSTWPRTKGIEDARAIQVTGEGVVVCYNRIRGFADAIDTFPSAVCSAIDIHNNEISEMTDDGIEMDYSQRNTRCFFNRLTNVFQGISGQPVYGGPVYVFRNAMYNVGYSTFKLHNSPSGVIMFHNTSVRKGMPLMLMTSAKVRNCVSRDNLFIGTGGNYAYECIPQMVDCDFDYDGFGGGPWEKFMKWSGARYGTLEEVKAKAGVYTHVAFVDAATAFASGVRPPARIETRFEPAVNDLRLKAGTAAVDAGEALPGFNHGYRGRAPDLGAYELNDKLPHYGPRPGRPAPRTSAKSVEPRAQGGRAGPPAVRTTRPKRQHAPPPRPKPEKPAEPELPPEEQELRRRYKEAETAFIEGDLDRAQELFRAIVEEGPDSEDARKAKEYLDILE